MRTGKTVRSCAVRWDPSCSCHAWITPYFSPSRRAFVFYDFGQIGVGFAAAFSGFSTFFAAGAHVKKSPANRNKNEKWKTTNKKSNSSEKNQNGSSQL